MKRARRVVSGTVIVGFLVSIASCIVAPPPERGERWCYNHPRRCDYAVWCANHPGQCPR